MNPRERIATILFIEQIKRTKANVCQGATYKELVLREESKDDESIRIQSLSGRSTNNKKGGNTYGYD